MAFTNRYSEEVALLAADLESGVSAEQNTGWIAIGTYQRVVVEIHAPTVGTSIDADIEIATDSSGTGVVDMTGKSITQLTDTGSVLIEINSEEFNQSNVYYTHMQVETTPAGTCDYVVLVKGLSPRFAPVTVATWDEIVT